MTSFRSLRPARSFSIYRRSSRVSLSAQSSSLAAVSLYSPSCRWEFPAERLSTTPRGAQRALSWSGGRFVSSLKDTRTGRLLSHKDGGTIEAVSRYEARSRSTPSSGSRDRDVAAEAISPTREWPQRQHCPTHAPVSLTHSPGRSRQTLGLRAGWIPQCPRRRPEVPQRLPRPAAGCRRGGGRGWAPTTRRRGRHLCARAEASEARPHSGARPASEEASLKGF